MTCAFLDQQVVVVGVIETVTSYRVSSVVVMGLAVS